MPGEEAGTGQRQEQQGPSRWQYLRSFIMQIMIFYFITSFFRGQKQPTNQEGSPIPPSVNVFSFGETFDVLAYLSEDDARRNVFSEEELIWELNHVTYGSFQEGPTGDSTWTLTKEFSASDNVQNNGSLWLHVFVRKTGYPIDREDEDYEEDAVAYQKKMLTRYRKRRIHSTVNLLTGESANNKTEFVMDPQQPLEIISYWHPNMTINLVADQTTWYKGSIPPPLDQFVVFDNSASHYYPIIYFNDYWNLAQDYMPVNDTTKTIQLTLTFYPLSLLKFQMYASMTTKNQWTEMFASGEDSSDEEQDTVKQTLMETNPYLLGLTMIVSIVHSVFEFLAFKNDIQFWRSRKSLEGLSVRSVFFNVFQSLIVLLYILDNDTNFVVIISCFVALLIEVWKITKVTNISIDRDNLVLGFLPRLKFTDVPSYVESSTKEYDKMAFKYLGWILFPLFMCYGVYSLIYQEHKGWYSFILGLLYGFLLTFGFIIMTPQLFINYKLKSVAHLPWRMLTYKALNTFIDDMFAFVIKMPMMYRIGCFRDDIVFFIYLYQRWIYRVDPKRVNEFGTTGEDATSVGDGIGSTSEDANQSQTSPPENTTSSPDSTESSVSQPPSNDTSGGSVRKRVLQNNVASS